MQCFHPITAWRSLTPNKTGKHSLVFNFNKKTCGDELAVACGKCIGCRLTKSIEWAVRCVHESKFHDQKSFITLTYDNEHLPEDAGLHHEDFQKFIKSYRKVTGKKIRYMMCGEYGETKPQDEKDYPEVMHINKTVVGKKKENWLISDDHIFTRQYLDMSLMI